MISLLAWLVSVLAAASGLAAWAWAEASAVGDEFTGGVCLAALSWAKAGEAMAMAASEAVNVKGRRAHKRDETGLMMSS
jgi:hypothetical protein